MISNKEYAKLLCDKVYNGNPKEMKYFVGSVLCAVETSRGLLAIKKPHVKTRICYGYGQGRDYESAQNASENVRSDYEAFLDENLFFDSASRMLKNIEKGCSVILDESGYGEGFACVRTGWDTIRKGETIATQEDVKKIVEALKLAVENLKKRCATYWKRFGGSKLETWTYWADE